MAKKFLELEYSLDCPATFLNSEFEEKENWSSNKNSVNELSGVFQTFRKLWNKRNLQHANALEVDKLPSVS